MKNFSKSILLLVTMITCACNTNPIQPPSQGAKVEKRIKTPFDGGAQVDILWVIDNSGSMCQEQEILAQNFDLFIDEIDKGNLDFHIGVTTTDMEVKRPTDPVSKPGHLQATPQPIPFIGPSRSCLNKLDDSGTAIENNYEPVRKALDRAIACTKTPAQAFVPTDADIACALVSGQQATCQIAGRCGGPGEDKCNRTSIFPTSDQYREIPSVLKAKDYKTGNVLDVAKLKADFSCMSLVGTLGWGVEKGLAAAVEATKPEMTGGPIDDPESEVYSATAANHGLLRKDSRFALVFVTDENDCSDDGSLEDQMMCGIAAACEYANIEGAEEGLVKLDNIKANLIENLSVSKNRPDLDESEIFVASIHGKPQRFTQAQKPDVCDPRGTNGVKHVCANTRGMAFSGDRYQRFLQTFTPGNYFPAEDDTEQGWLCAGDFAPALGFIGELIGKSGSGCITDSIMPCQTDDECPTFPYSGKAGSCIDRPGSGDGQKYCDSGIQIRAASPNEENLAALESGGYCEPNSVGDSEFPDGCVVSPEHYDFVACPAGLPGVKLFWNDEKAAKSILAGTIVETRFNSLISATPTVE